jgi:hypothetical protein
MKMNIHTCRFINLEKSNEHQSKFLYGATIPKK